MIVLGLLVLNYVIMALFANGREPSVTIPYSNPSGSVGFVQQVNAGNVDKVKTQGTTIEGEFKKEIRYPDDKAERCSSTAAAVASWSGTSVRPSSSRAC